MNNLSIIFDATPPPGDRSSELFYIYFLLEIFSELSSKYNFTEKLLLTFLSIKKTLQNLKRTRNSNQVDVTFYFRIEKKTYETYEK